MQIFDYPLNYGGSRTQYSEASDNDYSTSTTSSPMLIHIDTVGDGSGTAREFTDIFVKGMGITTYGIALTGGNIANPSARTIPTEVTNDSNVMVSTTVFGFQHDLWRIPGPSQDVKASAQSITLTFTGSITEVMILNEVLELTRFSRIEYDHLESGSIDTDLSKNDVYIPALGNTRDKWRVSYTAAYNPLSSLYTGMPTSEQINNVFATYKRFVAAPEFTRYPERVFYAHKIGDVQTRYRGFKGGAARVSFVIKEA